MAVMGNYKYIPTILENNCLTLVHSQSYCSPFNCQEAENAVKAVNRLYSLTVIHTTTYLTELKQCCNVVD